jgi:hypothetical protein
MEWSMKPAVLTAAALLALLAIEPNAGGTGSDQVSAPNTVVVSITPLKAGTGDEVELVIGIIRNAAGIGAFGLDIAFPTSIFTYLGVQKGGLTENWSYVNAGQIDPDRIRVGGFAGTGSQIAPGREGTLAILRFKVTCGSCKDGTAARICISSFVDGFAGMNGLNSCALFTLIK